MLAALILPHAYQLPALRSPAARAGAPTNVPMMAAGFFGFGGGGGGLPSEVTEVVNGFATEKDPAAIRALWTELKRAYGDEATAEAAATRRQLSPFGKSPSPPCTGSKYPVRGIPDFDDTGTVDSVIFLLHNCDIGAIGEML